MVIICLEIIEIHFKTYLKKLWFSGGRRGLKETDGSDVFELDLGDDRELFSYMNAVDDGLSDTEDDDIISKI